MTLNVGQLNSSVNFHSNISNTEKEENKEVKSELVSSPEKDEFQKEDSDRTTKTPKKKNLAKKIVLGTVSTILLIYGGVVLKRKLSKPSFEEIQKCFKEIFEKDLSADEVKSLIKKYKEICKNSNTDDFTKQLIEQLKKNYGIENVKTEINVTKLKDNKLKTALEQTEWGSTHSLGSIIIKPRTSEDNLIRSVQEDTFTTAFHEVKHMKQFADAYRTNPDKFAEAILKGAEGHKDYGENLVKEFNNELLNQVKNAIQIQPDLKGMTAEEVCKIWKEEAGLKTDKDIIAYINKDTISIIRKTLDETFGPLERYKPDSAEYKKGMKYIDGYANYTDGNVNYVDYRNNLLEKEAWHISDLAGKIYKYTSSIWKL